MQKTTIFKYDFKIIYFFYPSEDLSESPHRSVTSKRGYFSQGRGTNQPSLFTNPQFSLSIGLTGTDNKNHSTTTRIVTILKGSTTTMHREARQLIQHCIVRLDN